MAAIVGSTGPLTSSSGSTSLTWPAGSAVGHLAVCISEDWERPSTEWATAAPGIYCKRVTTTDLAAPVVVASTLAALVVLSAAGGPGRARSSSSCKLKAGGVAVWLGWMAPHQTAALAAATYQRGSTVADPEDGWRHGVYARASATAATVDPGSVSAYASWTSLEILPLAVPLAPVWRTVSGRAVDRTATVGLDFTHQSSSGLPVDRIKLAIRVAGGTWGSLKADGTIAAGDTSQEIPTSVETVTIAAGVLTANASYEAVIYSHDEAGWSPASGTLTFTARTPPALTVSLATAHNDLTPTVTHTITPGLGSQVSREVRISLVGAGPDSPIEGWSSGLLAGTGLSWTAPASTRVTNGASVVAWVRATDAALTSPWTASAAQTISWTEPAALAGIVAADAHPMASTVSGVPGGAVAIEWQVKVDGVWQPLATTLPTVTTLPDPLVPHAEARQYRARALHVVDGVQLGSAWVTSAVVTSTDRCAYLVSEDRTECLPIRVRARQPASPIQGRAVSRGIGADTEHVQHTAIGGYRGSVTVTTATLAALETLLQWLTQRDRFWLHANPEFETRLHGPFVDVPARLVSVVDVDDPEPDSPVARAGRLTRFTWTAAA